MFGRNIVIMLWQRCVGFEHNQGLGGTEVNLDKVNIAQHIGGWYPLFPMHSYGGSDSDNSPWPITLPKQISGNKNNNDLGINTTRTPSKHNNLLKAHSVNLSRTIINFIEYMKLILNIKSFIMGNDILAFILRDY